MAKGGMLINCDFLDARNVSEENYKDYEKIMINCDLVLSNKRASDVMAKLPIILNCDSVIELPDDIDSTIKTVEGDYTIEGTDIVEQSSILRVEDNLFIKNGTEDVLKNYYYILVGGDLICPKNLYGVLPKLKVDGSTYTYDGEGDISIQKSKLKLDKIFSLRAKPNTTYVARRIVYGTEEEGVITKLAESGVKFLTKEIVVRESELEHAVAMVDDTVEITVVPDGVACITGDATLDNKFIEETGGEAFVTGELELTKDSKELFPMIKHVVVNGNCRVPYSIEEEFSKLDIKCKKVVLEKGKKIMGLPSVKIDRGLLDASPDGISVTGVARVKLTEDIQPAEILEKLQFTGVAQIKCSKDQEAAVAAVSEGVAKIGALFASGEEGEDGMGVKDALGAVFGGSGPLDIIKGILSSKMVNADDYVL